MTLSTYLRNGLIGYFVSTIVMGIFAFAYEVLGHGVYSYRIRFAFVPCLLMLVLFYFLNKYKKMPYLPALTVLRILVVNETIRNVLEGVFEVYGTSFSKTKYFGYLSLALIGILFVLSIIGLILTIKDRKANSH